MRLTKEVLNKLEEDALKMNDNINLLGLVVGDGVKISDEKYKAFLETMNHEQRLELINELKRQKKKVPPKDLKDDYRRSDIAKLCSLYEGIDDISTNELDLFQHKMNHDQRLAFIETVKKRKGLIK